jgi:RNase adapter protein RapZ
MTTHGGASSGIAGHAVSNRGVSSHGAEPEIVIITGMSGAGRSTAAKSLEDLDWFVADNLPPGLLVTMLDLARRARAEVPRVAAVVDIRSRAFSTDLQSSITELHAIGAHPFVVFLEAGDETLVRRFENVRRPHPLQENGRVIDGIKAERDQLSGIREHADLIIDTTELNIHELRSRFREAFGNESDTAVRVNVVSFGFKYGLPVDADMVADCRFLPNPHWIPALAAQTGQDRPVKEYVLSQPGTEEFIRSYLQVLQITLNGYERSGKRFLTLAVGCTGGKHRSVVVAEELASRLAGPWPGVQVAHRDLGRE